MSTSEKGDSVKQMKIISSRNMSCHRREFDLFCTCVGGGAGEVEISDSRTPERVSPTGRVGLVITRGVVEGFKNGEDLKS